MILQRLEILNYKNIAETTLEFSPNVNCFIGHNGEGKTNLLDAIYFLSFTKSATNHIDSLNIRHGEDFLMLKGSYVESSPSTPLQITCGLKRGQAKQFRRNQKLYRRLSEHIGLIPLILVSPNDQELILGGSEERRRFMDQVISQYDHAYLESLSRCNKALQQRNTLLKKYADAQDILDFSTSSQSTPDPEILALYEEIMATEGEKIYAARKSFVEVFTPIFQQYYSRISGDKEVVGLHYISQCERGPLLETIQRGRERDKIVGYSLHGIHKDDLEMTLADYPIKREGSQGQNKTYLISLKLAEFQFLAKNNNSLLTPNSSLLTAKPILLLDDIFDKLDSTRVEQIINLVSDRQFGQIFITDTNRENIDRILEKTGHDYRLFTVHNGTCTC